MKLTRRQLRELIQESMGPIPFDPGRRIDKPGIADDVYNELIEPEVIEFRHSDIPENLKSAYDKVIDLAQQLQRASTDTPGRVADKLSYPIHTVDNALWSDFSTDLHRKMTAQKMPFSDQRRELQEDAIESAAEMIDSVMSANERSDSESKSIDLFMASEDADKLLSALNFLKLYRSTSS